MKNSWKVQGPLFAILFLSSWTPRLYAEENVEPYIEKIKNDMRKKGVPTESNPDSTSYVDSLRNKLDSENPNKGAPEKSYTEELKAIDPIRLNPTGEPSYTETEKQKLEPKEEESAIQAVKDGRSELRAKKKGEIRRAFGMKYTDGGLLKRDYRIRSGNASSDFDDVYSSGYSPQVDFFYEYQPYHSETYGSIGLTGTLGIGYFHSNAKLSSTVLKPDGTPFDTETDIRLQFFMFPITLGVNYRMNILRWIRPYASVGLTWLPYAETRSDNDSINKGSSRGYTFSVGAAIPVDWLSSSASWYLYQNYGFQRVHFTVDYSQLTTPSGKIDFGSKGILLGLTFEY